VIVLVSLFVYGPLTFIGIVLSIALAVRLLRKPDGSPKLLLLVQLAPLALWVLGCSFALVDRLERPDWQHMYWSAYFPLLGLFLCSGVLLCRIWPADAAAIGVARPNARIGGLLYFMMSLSLGLAPLFLEIVIPESPPSGRNIGAPLQRLWDLVAWSFGGPLPECLSPNTGEEIARRVGHLPREVTVPMGTLLFVAWQWTAFCALALVGRVLLPRPERLAFYLVAPALLGIVWMVLFAGPFDNAVWTSDPGLMRSFGPVLLGALIAALVLLLVRRRGSTQ